MTTVTRKDWYLATLIGFVFGWLILLPAKNFGFVMGPATVLGSVLGFSLFSPLALFVMWFLSRFLPFLYQFGKFAAVGALNTMIDLGLLNFLIIITDISAGLYFGLFKAISFLAAVTNSYYWNKFWTFGSRLPATLKEYVRFAFFTVIGLLINVSIASFIVSVLGPLFGSSPKTWANIGALIATVVSLLWNFFAYKYIVFKQQKLNNPIPT